MYVGTYQSKDSSLLKICEGFKNTCLFIYVWKWVVNNVNRKKGSVVNDKNVLYLEKGKEESNDLESTQSSTFFLSILASLKLEHYAREC